jgi:hypothetical protein
MVLFEVGVRLVEDARTWIIRQLDTLNVAVERFRDGVLDRSESGR